MALAVGKLFLSASSVFETVSTGLISPTGLGQAVPSLQFGFVHNHLGQRCDVFSIASIAFSRKVAIFVFLVLSYGKAKRAYLE
jgi:hypothetical protein